MLERLETPEWHQVTNRETHVVFRRERRDELQWMMQNQNVSDGLQGTFHNGGIVIENCVTYHSRCPCCGAMSGSSLLYGPAFGRVNA